MNHPCFQDPAWYHAITLTERIASLHTFQRTTPNGAVDAERAERRLQRWRSQAPFITDSYFAQLLAIDGISEDEFHYLLAEPIEAIRDRFPAPPTWLVELAQAFSRSPSPNSISLPETLRSKEMAGFLEAVEPVIGQARDRLQEGIKALTQTHSDLPFDSNTVENVLFANLPGQLIQMLSRTMVLELHVARLQGL